MENKNIETGYTLTIVKKANNEEFGDCVHIEEQAYKTLEERTLKTISVLLKYFDDPQVQEIIEDLKEKGEYITSDLTVYLSDYSYLGSFRRTYKEAFFKTDNLEVIYTLLKQFNGKNDFDGSNGWIGVGRLANKPNIKKTLDGTSVAEIVLNVGSLYFNGTAFGTQADYIAKKGKKGSTFFVSGRIGNNTNKNKQANKPSFVLKIDTITLI